MLSTLSFVYGQALMSLCADFRCCSVQIEQIEQAVCLT